MGPLLLNGVIDQGWSLVLMFIIGLAFGLILEQAGFSSSRKLVGIFFGYDFVVLKVFFTAGITAMVGLIFLQYFGLIDMKMVFINSNHLWSAVIGGVIMGFGFMLGGFCPGTSITAAVIGKIDAWIFIAGIFIGIFVFGSFNDVFSKLFTGYYFDGELLYNTLSISRAWFVMMMIIMAIVAFAVGHYFENKATIGLKPTNEPFKSYKTEVFVLLFLGIIILFIPENAARSFTERNEHRLYKEILNKERLMPAEEFAYRIMNDSRSIEIIDLRSAEDFNEMSFPNALNINLEELSSGVYSKYIDQDSRKVVFVSNGGVKASKAWQYAYRKGYDNIYVLEGGINNFIKEIFYNMPLDSNEYDFARQYEHRFKTKAALFFREGKAVEMQPAERKERSKSAVPKVSVQSAGGC